MTGQLVFMGLGNPGSEYALTRHNIGFMLMDSIAERFGFSKFSKKFNGLLASGSILSHNIFLFKPYTYMNNSGIPSGTMIGFYKIPLSNVLVFHDDIDVSFAKIKVKRGGGSAGHNGIKSLDAVIGKEYLRIRLGIGAPPENMQLSSYVLSKFEDLPALSSFIDCVTDNILLLLSNDEQKFISAVNSKS